MGGNPGSLLFGEEGFHIGVLAVAQNPNKDMGLSYFTSIRVDYVCRISSPVHFDLLSWPAGDVHGCTAALFILLDVVAELGVHKRFSAALTTGLQILRPQQLLVNAVPLEFSADIIEVWHLFGGADLRCLGEQRLLQNGIRHGVIQRP